MTNFDMSYWMGTGTITSIITAYGSATNLIFVLSSTNNKGEVTQRQVIAIDEAREDLKDIEVGDKITLINVPEHFNSNVIRVFVKHSMQVHKQAKITITADSFFGIQK